MLSTEERRERLEELLARVQRNRSKLGPGSEESERDAPAVEAVAPPAEAKTIAPTPPPEEPELDATIELDAEVAEVEVGDEPIELDMSAEADDAAMVIDLTPAEELEEEPPPVEAKPEPTAAVETPLPVVDATADPADTMIDDEPEIEVSYGTDEALALQAELGLGDDSFVGSDTLPSSDQLTLEDIQRGSDVAGSSGATIDESDLPAPAPPEANIDELLTHSTPPPPPAPPPVPGIADEDLPAPPPTIDTASSEADVAEPKIELTLDDEIGAADDVPTPVPTGEPAVAPVDVLAETGLDRPAASPAPEPEPVVTLEPSDEVAEEPVVTLEPSDEVEEEPVVTLESSSEIEEEPVSTAPAPQAPPAAAAALQPQTIEGPKPARDVEVADVQGTPPQPTITTFGALLSNALSVGKKK